VTYFDETSKQSHATRRVGIFPSKPHEACFIYAFTGLLHCHLMASENAGGCNMTETSTFFYRIDAKVKLICGICLFCFTWSVIGRMEASSVHVVLFFGAWQLRNGSRDVP